MRNQILVLMSDGELRELKKSYDEVLNFDPSKAKQKLIDNLTQSIYQIQRPIIFQTPLNGPTKFQNKEKPFILKGVSIHEIFSLCHKSQKQLPERLAKIC